MKKASNTEGKDGYQPHPQLPIMLELMEGQVVMCDVVKNCVCVIVELEVFMLFVIF